MMALMRTRPVAMVVALLACAGCKHVGSGLGHALEGIGRAAGKAAAATGKAVGTAAKATGRAVGTAAKATASAAKSAGKAAGKATEATAKHVTSGKPQPSAHPIAHPIGKPVKPPPPKPPHIVNASPVEVGHFGDGSAFFWNVGIVWSPSHTGGVPGSERVEPASVALLGVWPGGGETQMLRSPRSTVLEMVAAAQTIIDLSGPGLGEDGSVEPLLWALGEAADRGVRVRVLVDASSSQEAVDELAGRRGVEVRAPGEKQVGQLRAPYLVIDRGEALLAGEAFAGDSRGAELALLLRAPASVRALEDVFDTDWQDAGPAGGAPTVPPAGGYRLPEQATASADLAAEPSAARLSLSPVFAPRGRLPSESLWAQPALVSLIDGARTTLNLRLAGDDEGGPLDARVADALDRALRRGVRVQALALDEGEDDLRALSASGALELREGRASPWALTAVIADGARSYLGSGGLGNRALSAERHAGMIIEGKSLAGMLDRFFAAAWEEAGSGPIAMRE